jgi:cytochrome c oxidase assembly protein subunit 15
VPRGELGIHGAIEFGNRMLTFVLSAVAVAAFVAAWQLGRRELTRPALLLGLGVVFQALLGGATVLTDLNSWFVALHLLVSMVMVGIAVLLVRRVDQAPQQYARGALPGLACAQIAAAGLVLYLGTIVTGAGPHAGDAETPRNGIDPARISQLHTDAVFLLVGLTVGLLFALHATGASGEAVRAAWVLLGVELGQGTIGFVQYATDLPELLVGFHMLGAAVIAAVVTWSLLSVVSPLERSSQAPAQSLSSGSSATATKSSER